MVGFSSQLRRSLVFRMGMLRGAMLERIRHANECLRFADKLEELALESGDERGVESALEDLEALAGVGGKAGRNEKTEAG